MTTLTMDVAPGSTGCRGRDARSRPRDARAVSPRERRDRVRAEAPISSFSPCADRPRHRALAAAGPPADWLPRPSDAPLGTYLHGTHAVEAVHASMRGAHGTSALTPDGRLVVAGMG